MTEEKKPDYFTEFKVEGPGVVLTMFPMDGEGEIEVEMNIYSDLPTVWLNQAQARELVAWLQHQLDTEVDRVN